MLKELIDNSTFDNEASPYKEHRKFKEFRYYVATIRFKGIDSKIWINVGKSKFDSIYHLYDILPNKK